MGADPGDDGRVREIRLEGWGIGASAIVVAVLLVVAFWSGRVYERATVPESGPEAPDPLGNVSPAAGESWDDLTFFDTLAGGGKAAEPGREVRASRETPPRAAPAAPADGPFLVQVFAGRDRRAAEELVETLRGQGYPVRVEGEKEGRGTLLRVRVGGYATRAEAQGVAERLATEGHAGAWVTRRD